MKHFLTLVGVIAMLFEIRPAEAQQNVLIGTWSTTFETRRGPFGASWVRFDPNGRCQQRIMVPAGYYDYFCQYQLSGNGSVLRVRHLSYTPRNMPTIFPLNQVITTELQWVNRDLFIVIDGGVPTRYVRQR